MLKKRLSFLLALSFFLHSVPIILADESFSATPKNLEELKKIENTVKEVVKKVSPSVVAIQVGNSWGSGVIVSEDGLVLTAGHVVSKPGQPVIFIFSDGKKAKGKTLGMYSTYDAGMMKITDEGKWPVVEKGKSSELKIGQWVVTMGHPLGYRDGRPPVVRLGRVLNSVNNVIQTDCPMVGGDSGGPLFDMTGKVVGINSRIGMMIDQNMHVPVDIFVDNWDKLVKGESWQTSIPKRSDPALIKAFDPVVAKVNPCVVRIKGEGGKGPLGTIVGPDGWILTKASELKGALKVQLRDGREFDAETKGLLSSCDLAMLKIDAKDLPILEWNMEGLAIGQWVASPGTKDSPIAVGVVSSPRRKIPPVSGVIGVRLSEKEGAAQIEEVTPKSPAEQAGIKAKDIITHVNGETTSSMEILRAILMRHRPGDTIKLTIKRDKETLEISLQMVKPSSPALRQRDQMNSMGVGISTRSDDFPSIFQHDTVLQPADCGGPLVDLNGKVVGINIAHAGRTETYCLPSQVVMEAMYPLLSGQLNPKILAANEAELKKSLEAKLAAEKKAAKEKAEAEKKAAEEKAAQDKAAAEKKAAEEKAAQDKAAAEKKAAEEKAAQDKAAAEKKAAEEKAAQDKAAAEKKAAEEKAAQDKAAAEKKAAEEKAAQDKAAAEKKAAEEKAAQDKAAAEKKAAEEKAAKDKAAAEKKAAEEKAAQDKAAAEKKAA